MAFCQNLLGIHLREHHYILPYQELDSHGKIRYNLGSNGRRYSVKRAEGAKDVVLTLGLETLRQKNCRKQNLWRDLGKRAPKG
jgi:hypothetical protein